MRVRWEQKHQAQHSERRGTYLAREGGTVRSFTSLFSAQMPFLFVTPIIPLSRLAARHAPAEMDYATLL